MDYYFSKELEYGFEEAIERTTEALKKEGFGIISDIDVSTTLKKKIDVDFRKYRILGACNPVLAHRALLQEKNLGIMLPCNVVVQETGGGGAEVAVTNPYVVFQGVQNEALESLAHHVAESMKKVLEEL
ncbi:MAG: DUF302 domain-containing protein [Bacteroidota bacterium]